MKSAQLPPARVELTVREEIESCLRDGESLSQFIAKAVSSTLPPLFSAKCAVAFKRGWAP